MRKEIVSFAVDPGENSEQSGIVALGGKWEIHEGQ